MKYYLLSLKTEAKLLMRFIFFKSKGKLIFYMKFCTLPSVGVEM